MSVPVWLDCDPGCETNFLLKYVVVIKSACSFYSMSLSHDDAFAILLCDNPNVRLLGISTVHGNQTVEKTTKNAIKTLALGAMSQTDVVAGAAEPVPDRFVLFCFVLFCFVFCFVLRSRNVL